LAARIRSHRGSAAVYRLPEHDQQRNQHQENPMGSERRSNVRYRLTPLATALCLALGIAHAPVFAQEETAPAVKKDKVVELLEKLKAKGIITDEEYDELTGNTAEGRAEARAERRKQAAKEANEAQKAEAAKERYNGRWNNGINFETADRRSSFNLGGRIMVDYRSYDEKTVADTFDVRRAYLTLSGKWNEWLTWDLTGDFAQATTALDVAWVNAAWSDRLQVRAGQFKMPFSMEELGSSRFLDFQERSMMNILVPGKERGIMIHGVPTLGMTYGLALSNGQGKNALDQLAVVEGPDVIGRVTLNFAELLGQQAKAVYHVGLAGSVGDQSAGGLSSSRLVARNNENRGVFFFRTDQFQGDALYRRRLGVESAVAYGPVKFQGEIINVNYSGTNNAAIPYSRDINSYYVSALWLITGERYSESYRNGTFGRIVPISNFEPGGSGTGAWELGLRYSEFDASDFTRTNPAGTGQLVNFSAPTTLDGIPYASVTTNKATSTTIGLKWIWNPNFRLLLNYVMTRYETPITVVQGGYVPASSATLDKENTVMLRAAWDW